MKNLDDPSVPTNILLPFSLKRQLRDLATESGCTKTDIIRAAIKQFMRSSGRDALIRREKAQERAA